MTRYELRTVLHCKCDQCGYEWDAVIEKPPRCPNCRRNQWNGVDKRLKNPNENVARGSELNGRKPPTFHLRETLNVFTLVQGLLTQIITDNPCDHKPGGACFCNEKAALDKVNKQIKHLKAFPTGDIKDEPAKKVAR